MPTNSRSNATPPTEQMRVVGSRSIMNPAAANANYAATGSTTHHSQSEANGL